MTLEELGAGLLSHNEEERGVVGKLKHSSTIELDSKNNHP